MEFLWIDFSEQRNQRSWPDRLFGHGLCQAYPNRQIQLATYSHHGPTPKTRKSGPKKAPVLGWTFPVKQSWSTTLGVWIPGLGSTGTLHLLMQPFTIRVAISGLKCSRGRVLVCPCMLLLGVLSPCLRTVCSFGGHLTVAKAFQGDYTIQFRLILQSLWQVLLLDSFWSQII